jgi:sec-independent protein translocase protein TatA
MTPLFAVFGIGTQELFIVGLIVLVLFGHRLPSVMGSLGKGIKDFKKGLNEDDEDDRADAGRVRDEKGA